MSIIPRPQSVQLTGGELLLDEPLWFSATGSTEGQREAIAHHSAVMESVLESVGITPGTGDAARTLTFDFDEDAGPQGSANPERYTLRITSESVRILAPEIAGLWYGVLSLVQLVHREPADGVASVPCGVVIDEPRYPWRGLSLDVARHFVGPADLRRAVDLLARYKMNRLHLHLTDDQGWRLESPSRPELTALSSGSDCSGGPGGYLTADEFRDLQAYAADRFVTLVPEIDVPGHVNAATHAYGELRRDGMATEAYTGTEVGFSTLEIDLPTTEPFLRDVFGDLAALTDGPYLHYGGDEPLATDRADYLRFIELCERIVRGSGKTPVAWNEAAAGAVGAGTLLQYWDTRRADLVALRRAADAGARIIMSPGAHTYLDMKYTADFPLGQDWAGLIELRDSYEWEPATLVEGLEPASIEGVEAAIWTEFIPTYTDVETMLLPRLTAVAEVAWTDPARKDFGNYCGRVAVEAARWWRPEAISYYPTPQVEWVE